MIGAFVQLGALIALGCFILAGVVGLPIALSVAGSSVALAIGYVGARWQEEGEEEEER